MDKLLASRVKNNLQKWVLLSAFLFSPLAMADGTTNFLHITLVNHTAAPVYVKLQGTHDWIDSCQSPVPAHSSQLICGDQFIPLIRGQNSVQDGDIYITTASDSFEIHYQLDRQKKYISALDGLGIQLPDNTRYEWQPLELRKTTPALTIVKNIETHVCHMNKAGECTQEVILQVD